MSATPYDIEKKADLVFTFTSVGPKGNIPKIILYEKLIPNVFNLGFGDQVEDAFDFDDTIRSNNGDLKQIMATVIATIPFFFEKHPKKSIYITGSTLSRTRLYLRIVNSHFDELSKIYEFQGGVKPFQTEPFVLKKEYDFILIGKIKDHEK